jgi:hypothetical protein
MSIIEFIIQIIFIEIVGVYSRYVFFRFIGKKRTIDYLLGKNLIEEESDKQNLYNALVGIIVGFFIIILFFYLIF